MVLPKDIFATTKEYIKFLLFIYSEKVFTVEQLSSEFNISKWVIYKQVKYWKRLKYVSIIKMIGKKAGKQYHYQITDVLNTYLKDILVSILKSRGASEQDLKKLLKEN